MDGMSDYVKVCEQAVRAGGAVLQDRLGRVAVRQKLSPGDLVTEADFASEEVIRRTVLDVFPDHGFLGEETVEASKPRQEAEYRWIADPLDGTTNYVHQVPSYCVSLALVRNSQLLVGAVYDPTRDECFLASVGGGAFLNGQPIRTSDVTELQSGLAAVGFPPDVSLESPDMRLFLKLAPFCQAIRRIGSTALNLCYLASGRFDLYWCYSAKIWDVAAGLLLVQEAGGTVIAPDGGEPVLEDAQFLAAATPTLARRLLEHAEKAFDVGP